MACPHAQGSTRIVAALQHAALQVWAAQQIDNGRFVALKVIFLGNPRLESDAVDVLKQEYRLMSRLNHPNIVKIDCAIEDHARRQLVIAEEICAGGTLLEELQYADTNDDRMLVIIFKQVVSALAYMHDKMVLHRDIKPENIIFRHEHKYWNERGAIPLLIDFGMATLYRPKKPQRGLMGSPGVTAKQVVTSCYICYSLRSRVTQGHCCRNACLSSYRQSFDSVTARHLLSQMHTFALT